MAQLWHDPIPLPTSSPLGQVADIMREHHAMAHTHIGFLL